MPLQRCAGRPDSSVSQQFRIAEDSQWRVVAVLFSSRARLRRRRERFLGHDGSVFVFVPQFAEDHAAGAVLQDAGYDHVSVATDQTAGLFADDHRPVF